LLNAEEQIKNHVQEEGYAVARWEQYDPQKNLRKVILVESTI
jgi:hypothetical protein